VFRSPLLFELATSAEEDTNKEEESSSQQIENGSLSNPTKLSTCKLLYTTIIVDGTITEFGRVLFFDATTTSYYYWVFCGCDHHQHRATVNKDSNQVSLYFANWQQASEVSCIDDIPAFLKQSLPKRTSWRGCVDINLRQSMAIINSIQGIFSPKKKKPYRHATGNGIRGLSSPSAAAPTPTASQSSKSPAESAVEPLTVSKANNESEAKYLSKLFHWPCPIVK
jgi:hypothetical protein